MIIFITELTVISDADGTMPYERVLELIETADKNGAGPGTPMHLMKSLGHDDPGVTNPRWGLRITLETTAE